MIRKATVEGGKVVGIPAADPRITAFKGIPFAAPPVGENRWRAPQPVVPWEGERECFTFAPISMQHIPGLDKDNIYSREWNVDPDIPMSEDCLYLNVWTPAKSPDEKLPVFVWYFGGGLKEGNPAEMEFDGERIARRGVVVVTVNYRVSVFGFLAHPEITAAQPDAPANFGLLDQRAGALWAKRNIAAFGGDPDNITIGGQSAGGVSVCAHLTSPMNEGVFQKAVALSGIAGTAAAGVFGSSCPLAEAEQFGVEFFDLLGVKTLAEARALDAVYVRDKSNEIDRFFRPIIDGVFQTGDPMENLVKGNYWHVPLLSSRTTNEMCVGLRADTMEAFRALAHSTFGSGAEELLALCDQNDPEKAGRDSSANITDVGTRALAMHAAAQGITAPIYYDIFDVPAPGWDQPGAFHSSDLWFWFETLAKGWRPYKGCHYDLARQMCNYLCNFIRSGDPNGPDHDGTAMPYWAPACGKPMAAMWLRTEGPCCRIEDGDRVASLSADAFYARTR